MSHRGVLDLGLAPSAGRTRVKHQYQRSPLYLFHPLHLDPGRPDMAFLYLMQSGEGLVQGDEHRLNLECAAGTYAHVTTPSAQKIHGVEHGTTAQTVRIRAEADSYLEYVPGPTIPFRRAHHEQRLELTVEESATVVLAEVVLPGRVARGERHEYDSYRTHTEARTRQGRLLFADTVLLGREHGSVHTPGLLGSYEAVATLHVVCPGRAVGELAERLERQLDECGGVLAGVGELPNAAGLVVRLLTEDPGRAAVVTRSAWDAVRNHLIGTPAPDLAVLW